MNLKNWLLASAVVIVSAGLHGSMAGQRLSPSDVAKWREDLAVYREQMPEKHGSLFHTMTRRQFEASIDALEQNLPQLTANQATVEILRLVALVNDGHTRARQETLGQHMLPIRLHYFADGLYVEAGDRRFAAIVGGKVTRIGSMTVDAAYAAVRPLISVDADNDYRRKLLAADLLVTPEVLQALGAATSASSVDLTVEKDGRAIAASVPAAAYRPWNNHGWPVDPEGWVNARDFARNPLPLWLRHTARNYWHEFVDNGKTLYVQYNNVQDEPGGEPIARYFPRVFQEAEKRNVTQVVLDLRLNGGGDNELNRPIWHALIKSDSLNRKGRIWVLISPMTFSAAMNCVDDLELNTNALFAGEPTGETPNMWGDPVDVRLPNSGVVIRASTLWWQLADPRDRRQFRAPDLLVPLTFADYAGNIDRVMSAIAASWR